MNRTETGLSVKCFAAAITRRIKSLLAVVALRAGGSFMTMKDLTPGISIALTVFST